MRRKIDTISLAFGILLSALVAGMYDAVKNAIMGNYAEANASTIATVIIIFILFPMMYHYGFFKREDDGDHE
jgi:hypothetical protein